MTALYLLFGITVIFVLAVVLSEWLFRRLWRQGKALGCTCPDDMHYHQNCPLHDWSVRPDTVSSQAQEETAADSVDSIADIGSTASTDTDSIMRRWEALVEEAKARDL